MGNFNPNLPTKYQGTNKYITFFVTRDRRPTLADYRQPETGTLYSYGTVWQVGKNPTTGTEGELWMLATIIANQGYWIMLSSGSPPVGPLLTLSDTAGTKVSPDGTGNIQLVGGQAVTVVSTPLSNLLTISAVTATTSQIGVVTLATQAQHEFNTYGTTQVLQSQFIPQMMAKPAPIGSTTPNTGAFTSLSSNAGQTFTTANDTFPSTNTSVRITGAASTLNVTARYFIRSTTPAGISNGFGTGLEIFGQNTAGTDTVFAEYYGVIETTTPGAEVTYGLVQVTEVGVTTAAFKIYGTRVELPTAAGRYRIGAGGVDFMSGTGDPNGTVTAAKGSYYARLDGSSASTRAYINTNGATAWTSVTTAT